MFRYLTLIVFALTACTSEPTDHQPDISQADTNPNRLTCTDLQKLSGAQMLCNSASSPCTVETDMTLDKRCQSRCSNYWYHPSDELEWWAEKKIVVHSNFYGTFSCTIIYQPSK